MKWYLLAFKKYATFKGRSSRKEFWLFVLFNFIAANIIGLLSGLVARTTGHLARIIHDHEDTKSLFCYKHVVETVFVRAREAFACSTIARHSVGCNLLWKFIKAGCVDRGLFRAASEGVPQGGVISPLLSNIMLHEFDVWMERNYLSKKVRKDRWAWNFAILKQRPIAVREHRQWKPAISYCRYADDFVIVVKGTREHAEAVREACRGFLERELKLTLNMEKTHITHVNDGFVFLGHRVIRKRGPRGRMRPVTTIPWEKYRGFAGRLVKQLSGNYNMNRMDLMESLNRQLVGWAAFYQYTDYTATMFRKVDRTVFWKLGYWLARKYRRSFRSLMRDHVRRPELERAKTWVLKGQNSRGRYGEVALRRLITSRKGRFTWRTPSENPYILRDDTRRIIESRYADVTFAMSNT